MKYDNIIYFILELVKLSPSILSLFNMQIHNTKNNNIIKFMQKLIEIARVLTNEKDTNKVVQKFKTDENLLIEFQSLAIKAKKEILDIEMLDRQNARNRNIILHNNGYKSYMPHIMLFLSAIGTIMCPLTIVWYINIYDNIPGEVVAIVSTATTIFGSCLKSIYTFEFGESSKNYQYKEIKKNGIIRKIHMNTKKFITTIIRGIKKNL
ncbi:hypothetical protein [Candidatus Gromoviella agglomerans]|uniref:hypothetical protein n=1 Tax=Candidatus Gromoviella agglomerans TaxID=2806609 RepID=UPI001E47022E|nr:hypothetical protein [Candidatus Gromoviella agglomerans]UFX98270.1 hypothetical protein Gromo_00153 [Candidatus Gromoviella agglomerans]